MCCGIACCVGSALCCAGQAFCQIACCACSLCGINPKNFAKIAFVIFDLLWFGVAILIMFTMQPLFEKYDFLQCSDNSGGGDVCLGVAAVLRMSFVLFIFHLFILLIMLPRA